MRVRHRVDADNQRRASVPLSLLPVSMPLHRLPAAVYGPFGGAQMTVKQAKADAADAPAPAPTPEADAKKQEKQQEDKEKEAAAAPQPAAESPAGGSAGACTLQLAAGAAPQAFAGCRRIVLGQTQMHLLWSSAPVAGNPAVRAASGWGAACSWFPGRGSRRMRMCCLMAQCGWHNAYESWIPLLNAQPHHLHTF